MRSPKTEPAGDFARELDGERFLLVGETVGVHGVRGETRVRLFNPDSAVLKDVAEVVLVPRGGRPAERRFAVRRARPHGGVWLLWLEGLTSRNDAGVWVGCGVAVPEQSLGPPGTDEYYWYQLIGLEVVDEKRGVLGQVRNLITAGGNDVLEVVGSSGEVLVPMTSEVIRRVDVPGGRIRVRLPEGLLDL